MYLNKALSKHMSHKETNTILHPRNKIQKMQFKNILFSPSSNIQSSFTNNVPVSIPPLTLFHASITFCLRSTECIVVCVSSLLQYLTDSHI